MTLAFVSTGSIPLPLRHGLPPFAPETSAPPGEFAVLLAARATLGVGSGAGPTDSSAPAATAFDQGQLFGTAVATADPVREDVPSVGTHAATVLSASRTPPGAVPSGAAPSHASPATEHAQAEAEIAQPAEVPDLSSAPHDRFDDAIRIDRVSGSAPQAIGARSPVSGHIGESVLSVAKPAPAATLPLRSKMPIDSKTPPLPRRGDASLRAAMIERLGPVYVSIQSEGAATHILARVAGVRNDEEDAVAQSLRDVAEAAGVEVGTLFLNGTGHSPVKRG